MFDLEGKVALVTGAGQNIGAGVAKLLARQGARVAVNDLFDDRARASARAIVDEGGEARGISFDVSDLEAVRTGVAEVESQLGPIDILVNNAGVPPEMGVSQFRDLDAREWAAFIDVNLYGVLNCCKTVIDGMVERGFGRIITISSGAGQTGIPLGVSIYGAAKAGGIGFTRHFALEIAGTGVTANCIALGLMDNVGGEEVVQALARTVPAKRLGTPEDVGAAVVYLASDEASWVTGQTLGVNGGSHTP